MGQARVRTGGGTTDDLREGAGVLQVGEEVGSVASGPVNARIVSVNGLGNVKDPVRKVALVKEALKIG